MGFPEWLSTRDWSATGAMLTAAFTGATLVLAVRHKSRPRLTIEPAGETWATRTSQEFKIGFIVKNMGSLPAMGVKVYRVRPGVGRNPVGGTTDSLAPGASKSLSLIYATENLPDPFDEESGEYPYTEPRFDTSDDSVEVTWLHPPQYKAEKSRRVRVTELRTPPIGQEQSTE